VQLSSMTSSWACSKAKRALNHLRVRGNSLTIGRLTPAKMEISVGAGAEENQFRWRSACGALIEAPDPARSRAPSLFDTRPCAFGAMTRGRFFIPAVCCSYLRVGEELVSTSSKDLAAGGAAWPPSMMSLALSGLP